MVLVGCSEGMWLVMLDVDVGKAQVLCQLFVMVQD